MEKVSEKWFKEHGWIKYEDVSDVGDSIRKCLTYTLYYGKDNRYVARYDRIVYIHYPKNKYDHKRVSRSYMFYANGENRFTVCNRISHHNFDVDTIVSAMNTVGYDEFGKKK